MTAASESPALKERILRVQTSTFAFKEQLTKRLMFLVDAFADDYEGCQLSMSSMDAFLTFLELSSPPRYPDITLTPAGDVYAEWRNDRGASLSIEFLSDGDVRYIVLRPNPNHPQRIDRLSGLTTSDALLVSIKSAVTPTTPTALMGFAA